MRKIASWNLDDEQPASRKRFGVTLKALLVIMLLPLIFEGTQLCIAQWRSLHGPVQTVRTPVLDYLSGMFSVAGGEVRNLSGSVFNGRPWKPEVVIPLTLVWTGIGILILRRS